MRINIANVQPNFPQVFDEVVRLLTASLTALGHDVSVIPALGRGALNIVLGLTQDLNAKLPADIDVILYQLEPLTESDPRYRPSHLDTLRQAREVWEYNPRNLRFLQDRGFTNVKLVPIGYHESLATIPKLQEEPIDALFYGVPTPRREQLSADLVRRLGNVRFVAGFGPARDRLIAQSRIVLNVHQFEDQPFEAVRVSYLLNNARCVVSEEAGDNPYPGAIATAPYYELGELCQRLTGDAQERDRIARQGAQIFRAMPMTEILKQALE